MNRKVIIEFGEEFTKKEILFVIDDIFELLSQKFNTICNDAKQEMYIGKVDDKEELEEE